eukprot:1379509-Lingulodinium_polyedra.AAC.1
MGLLLGLDSLVAKILAAPSSEASDYHLAGYTALHEGHTQTMMCVCAIGSVPADVVLYSMLQDSRAGIHAPGWRQAMQEMVAMIEGLDPSVWGSLSCLLKGITPVALRSMALQVAYTNFAYLDKHVFSAAMQLP